MPTTTQTTLANLTPTQQQVLADLVEITALADAQLGDPRSGWEATHFAQGVAFKLLADLVGGTATASSLWCAARS